MSSIKPTVSPSAPVKVPVRVLRVADRCDRCGAQAFVKATLPGAHPLLFCGHHYRKHEPALLQADARIIDERSRINPKP
ncbi:hypothetical protein SEA_CALLINALLBARBZ_32 [Arthrobacter phage CallinAllBarbz]|uniref:DUF7455 domain-containing protein n=1 Tax=Arthrobacter phage CallinAllBarbz TaxID=3077790 RepID=A0AA96HD85_9CAUD|nr:hypothetical protein SEA_CALLINALLBARBZ_32 [Arthrobacter phage CallinAllBarbz]